MYNDVRDSVFDGILSAAIKEFVEEELASVPSDGELAEMYPVPSKMIKKYKRKVKERQYQLPISLVYLRRVAVVFLAIVSIAFGVFATSEDVRAAIVNTVVTWYEKYVQMNFSKSQNFADLETNDEAINTIPEFNELEISYIPLEYDLISSNEDKYTREYIYTSNSGGYIFIGIYKSTITEIATDIELMEYTQIKINKNDGYIFINESEKTVSLVFGNNKYSALITAISEKDEIIKVAENIK